MLTQALIETIAQDYIENKTRLNDLTKFSLHIVRFLSRILVNETKMFEGTPCWEWQGPPRPVTGYCEFVVDGRRGQRVASSPHRFSYLYFIGDFPDGQEPDHRCHNRICASPFHLEAVTHQTTCQRRLRDTEYCKHGHPRTPENTNKRGGCQICARERVKAFYARNPGYMARQNRKRRT